MKKIFLFVFLQLFIGVLLSQEYIPGALRVVVLDDRAKPISELKTSDPLLNVIFENHNVNLYKQAMPWTDHPFLKRVYQIQFLDQKTDQFIDELLNTNLFKSVIREYKPIPAYDPSDYMWQAERDWVWHLTNLRASEAWDITHGGSAEIAIIDTRFDLGHPDLVNEFILPYDPYTMINHTTYQWIKDHSDNHGTVVASFAIAETDGGGQLSSIGFDTQFYGYTWGGGIYKAQHASEVLGVDVISISWYYSCSPDPTGVDSTIIADILNNGTVIVAAAGNGAGAGCPADGPPWTPIFPFSPTYDDRIICVSSIGEDNKHFYQTNSATHSHFPEVDICAPGYEVMGAKPSLNSEWPYFGGYNGTSYATPMVAGVAALMRSLDNSLTPAEIGAIIEETAEPILDESSYSGMLGAGRINAYKAVLAARPVHYTTVPYATDFEDKFDTSWKLHKSNEFGRIEANTDHSPKSGSRHLTMDVSINGHYCTNEAWMHLNLSGESDVALSFWWKETGDESHTTDGIYLSDNGGSTFTKVYNLTNGSSTYQNVILDISNEIASHSLSHSGNFVVKFQQYDNYSMTTDGMAFDDINVCKKPSKPSWISSPYEHCIFDWEEYICATVSDAVSYEWATDDVGLMLSQDGTNKVDVKAIDEDYYTLKVRAKNICDQYSDWKTKSIFIENCGGPLKMTGDDPFVVYPNPADDEIIIEANKSADIEMKEEPTEYQISIVDQVGIVLHSKTYAELPVIINSVNFKDGLYTVTIRFGESQYSYDIVIKH